MVITKWSEVELKLQLKKDNKEMHLIRTGERIFINAYDISIVEFDNDGQIKLELNNETEITVKKEYSGDVARNLLEMDKGESYLFEFNELLGGQKTVPPINYYEAIAILSTELTEEQIGHLPPKEEWFPDELENIWVDLTNESYPYEVLIGGFDWKKTEVEHTYWSKLYHNLEREE